MSNEGTIETPSESLVRFDEAQPVTLPVQGVPTPPSPIQTPAQAKIDAVAKLTMDAYQRASQLELSDEEVMALTAPFPDEDFEPGAAGKEHLIYIKHSALRQRLNSVLKPGQWSIVPRSRWAEDFRTGKGTEASRVYVEAMLLIRGCFAGEAIGEMTYYPKNESQNYGDAVEGAKTAALRRCCKELGVGLQAWDKSWCDGWWARKRGSKRAPAPTPQRPVQPTPRAPVKPSAPKPEPVTFATEHHRERLVERLAERADEAKAAMVAWGWLLETEGLTDLPLRFVPVNKDEFDKLIAALNDFGGEGPDSMPPYEPHLDPLPPKGRSKAVTDRGTDDAMADAKSEEWFNIIVPVPHKGERRDEYLKHPDTIGSLYAAMKNGDQEAGKRLWGFVSHYEPKGWTKRDGTEMPPSDDDLKFRDMLDLFADWHQKRHPTVESTTHRRSGDEDGWPSSDNDTQ